MLIKESKVLCVTNPLLSLLHAVRVSPTPWMVMEIGRARSISALPHKATRTHPAEGRLLEPEQVGGAAIQRANHNVDRRHRPREGEVIEHRLVEQIEADVQPVPVDIALTSQSISMHPLCMSSCRALRIGTCILALHGSRHGQGRANSMSGCGPHCSEALRVRQHQRAMNPNVTAVGPLAPKTLAAVLRAATATSTVSNTRCWTHQRNQHEMTMPFSSSASYGGRQVDGGIAEGDQARPSADGASHNVADVRH